MNWKNIFFLSFFLSLGIYADEIDYGNANPFYFKPGDEFKILQVSEIQPTTLVDALKELILDFTDSIFGDDFFRNLAQTVENSASGEYVEYWPNGQLKAKIPYLNNFPEGHVHGWYEDGTDAFKGFFRNGKKIGAHIVFFPNIKKWPVPDNWARILCYNENGQLNGKQIACHPLLKGQIARIHFKNGRLHGETVIFDAKSHKIKYWRYTNGKLK